MSRKLFLTSVILKILLIVVVVPNFQSELFIPFLEAFKVGRDPWQDWISSGGALDAFPYGLIMLLIFLPIKLGSVLSNIFSWDLATSFQVMFSLIVLAIDITTSVILRKSNASLLLQITYAFSPLVIWINFILGQTDLIPAIFLLLSAHFLITSKSGKAGAMLGLAIGAKFSILLAVPFFLVYFYDNPRFSNHARRFFAAACMTTIINYSPLLFSRSFRQMVIDTPETRRLQDFSIDFGSAELYLFPVIYTLLLYWLWRTGRTSIQVLFIFIATALLALSVISSSSVGWTLWGIPLLCLVVEDIKLETALGLNLLFTLILISHLTIASEIAVIRFGNEISFELITPFHNLSLSLTITLAAIILGSILHKGLENGDYFKIGNKPLTISIAGDSGVGKDTLTSTLESAFGEKGTIVLAGDGYHKYERNDSTWRLITHLHPDANHLDIWAAHFNTATRRRKFQFSEYNHENGRFFLNKVEKIGDLIISQGLHALYEPVSKNSDLKIYLSMEPKLKTELKISRDTSDRKQDLKSIRKQISSRKSDYVNYVAPQSENADLLIHLERNSKYPLSEPQIFFRCRNQQIIDKLQRILMSVNGVQLDSIELNGDEWFTISIEYYYRLDLSTLVKSCIKKSEQLFPTQTMSINGSRALLSFLTFYLLAEKRKSTHE
jgi:uridine kinase/Gpi18-like mannosyltransferase